MKSIEEIEAELILKSQRVEYWETFHKLPNMEDLNARGEREFN